ncbi:hypothetical protein AX15_004339 [Amanita polypyramis BW_CC]|nr:hypothetical protein AX15_004339 [Amanita polypyramis BW_CC]
MHALSADIYSLTCSSLALSLAVLAIEYYDFWGHATFFVGTAVSSISIVLQSSTLVYHYTSGEDADRGRDTFAASLPFVLIAWAMAYLWTCALAAITFSHLLGISQLACYSPCWLNAQGIEFVLILCEIANTLLIAIWAIRERRTRSHRYLYLRVPYHHYETESTTPSSTKKIIDARQLRVENVVYLLSSSS